MWIDIIHGYVNESCIEFIENMSVGDGVKVRLHTVSGRTIDVSGIFAINILNYARLNKVQFVSQLQNPVGLSGGTL